MCIYLYENGVSSISTRKVLSRKRKNFLILFEELLAQHLKWGCIPLDNFNWNEKTGDTLPHRNFNFPNTTAQFLKYDHSFGRYKGPK